MKLNSLRVLIVLMLVTEFASAFTCPGETYASGDSCTMASDNSIMNGDKAVTIAPDDSSSDSNIAPDGSNTEESPVVCPDGSSYASPSGCGLQPDSSYTGSE